jgi:hypothetical protein
MISVIDKNILNNNPSPIFQGTTMINTDDIDGVIREKKVMGSSPDPNEIKLVPMVLYTVYLTIKEIDKVFVNSIKISGKDIKFIHTDKNNILITLNENDFSDDIVIDYDTKQDLRENKINELGVCI